MAAIQYSYFGRRVAMFGQEGGKLYLDEEEVSHA